MARIPDGDIDRIKRETDLAALVRSRGIELRKHGTGNLVGKCPFHNDDKTPNLIVTPAKGLWHCMACGAAGNAIQFVEKFDGVSFRHAFELLDEGRAAFTAPADTPVRKTSVARLEAPVRPDAGDAELMEQVVAYYHERLLKTPAALDYLKKRGVHDEDAIRVFKIGFADRTLGLRLPYANRKEGAEIRTRLQTLGIIRESGHEHFNGSIVMPVFTESGEVGEIYGRKIGRKLNEGSCKHLYLPGPHAGIWNREALDSPELILCEAPLDALTFYVNGFKNVTFIFGTEGFTDELFDAILARKIQRIRIAYDADEAGNRAADRDAARLMAHGIECFRVRFPHGMDANEYARKMPDPQKALQSAINAAEWLGGRAEGGNLKPEGNPPAQPATPEPCAEAGAPSSLAAELAANEKTSAPPFVPFESFVVEKSSSASSSALPAPSAVNPSSPSLERLGDYHVLRLGSREYRVGGLDKNNSLEVMKIALRLRHGECFHLDGLDLTRDGDRRRFIERAAEETTLEKELIKRDLGKLLLALEEAQTARLAAALDAKPCQEISEMPPEARAEALDFLTAPDLISRLKAIFPACGLAGEVNNLLGGYLACTSRKLDRPLAIIIQSTSAAGKSTLMEAVLSMFPEEERVKYSAMTGQSLYYLGETNLQHKILAIVEEAGAEKASYALKLLQSEGELTIASTGKNPQTGRMETQEYRVEGPVMIFLTTTAIEIDEELLNRALVLTVDESREQTERIHALQRQARTLEGLRLKKAKPKLLNLLRNAQRLLEPLAIMNPYAHALTFPAELTRTRRDHEKYLTLMDSITLLHQHQRPRETNTDGERFDFIRVTLDDIALANQLAPELLGRSLDELPPQTRRLLIRIKEHVRERMNAEQVDQNFALFSRRDLRRLSGWSEYQVRVHLNKLEELEYVARRWGRQGQGCMYELLTDIHEPDNVWHITLLDVGKLRKRETAPTTTTRTSCISQAASCIKKAAS